jgi:hypothetical protein
MGAASVPLFAMLACQLAMRGYVKGPRTMLWASSEGGLLRRFTINDVPSFMVFDGVFMMELLD